MNRLRAYLMAGMMLLAVSGAYTCAQAQEATTPDNAETTPDSGGGSRRSQMSFGAVIFSSGWLGVVLWLTIFGVGGAGIYFAVDSGITVKEKRMMPDALVNSVNEAMAEGDVMKALKSCEDNPGPLANILTAGFSHVEDGFEVIQEAIGSAAEMEAERVMQKLTWLAVCANLAPMLGLLGTVQGMILCFANIAQGAPDVGLLALSIAQALYTTAGGLTIAVPVITTYYALRNNANTIILKMEALTMEMIKDLRHVEVVPEGEAGA